MAHCALADAQHAQDTAVLAGGKVTSESVGKWSRSIQQDDEQSGSLSAAACVSPPNISPSAAGCCTGGERMLTPNASCTLYLQTGPGAYRRIFCPSVFWQEDEDGVSIVIPEDLPEQYKGEKREKGFHHARRAHGRGHGHGEQKKALIADKPLTVKNLVHCAFGGLPHCEVTTE